MLNLLFSTFIIGTAWAYLVTDREDLVERGALKTGGRKGTREKGTQNLDGEIGASLCQVKGKRELVGM